MENRIPLAVIAGPYRFRERQRLVSGWRSCWEGGHLRRFDADL